MANNPEEDIHSIDKNLPEPSQEFYALVEEFAQSFEKPKEVYKKLVDRGREEGFTDDTIDMLIGSYLKGRVHRNTLANYRKEFLRLPEVHKNMHIDDKKVIEHSSVDEQDNEPASLQVEEPPAPPPREEVIEDAEIVNEDVFGEYDVTVYFAGKDVTMKANITRDSFVMVGPNQWVRIIINKRK